jgi:predicted DNA-binding protein with PD1-like motif
MAPDGRIVVRLNPGDEVLPSLKAICEKEGVESATVIGIGACRKAEIAHYDTKRKAYHNKIFKGMLELVSLSGNISMKDGAPFLHLHASIGLPDFSLVGGHLVDCEVNPTCEIVIMPLALRIAREQDERSGLAILKP